MSFNALECVRRVRLRTSHPFLRQLSLERSETFSVPWFPLQGKGSMVEWTPSFPSSAGNYKRDLFLLQHPEYQVISSRLKRGKISGQGQIKFSAVRKGCGPRWLCSELHQEVCLWANGKVSPDLPNWQKKKKVKKKNQEVGVQVKIFLHSKIINKMKRQSIYWEKMFATRISNKW